MNRVVWLGLCLLVPIASRPARAADPIFPGKSGAELRSLLRANYTPNTYLSYNAARAHMFAVIDNNGGSVELAYTSETFPINSSNPIPRNEVVNTEHTWPQSMFSHKSGPGMQTDLHHLFPCRSNVNSDRGNKPFADILDAQTLRWYRDKTPRTSPPTSEIEKFSEATASLFEPEEDHKGNVARAMVYFFTIYENDPAVVKSFLPPQVPFFREWHRDDKADAAEVERGRRIELVQDNVNPFVLDESLLERALVDIAPVPTGPIAGGGGGTPTTPPIGSSPVTGGGTTDAILEVVILAALPNPIGQDEGKENVTLANGSNTDVDLAGWKLVDRQDREFALSGALPANQTRSFTLPGSGLILGNNGGQVALVDADGETRQVVSYTKEQARSGTFVLFGN